MLSRDFEELADELLHSYDEEIERITLRINEKTETMNIIICDKEGGILGIPFHNYLTWKYEDAWHHAEDIFYNHLTDLV